MTYLKYVNKILAITLGDKSTNTYRILFALNNYPNGATYTDLLNYSPAFNQSALSRTLKACLKRNLLEYDHATKLYTSNYYFDVTSINEDNYKWLKILLASTLVGCNTTLIRIAIYIIAVDTICINDLANKISISVQHAENAILSLTEALGTNIIIYDKTSMIVSANPTWFK